MKRMRIEWTKWALLAMVPLLLGAELVPNSGRIQGRLFDDQGYPLAGPVDIALAVYAGSEGGTALYQEEHTGVALTEGSFAVVLGEGTTVVAGTHDPSLYAGASERWIEVAVDGEALTPRQRIHAVPYAMVAEQAATAPYDAGVIGSDLAVRGALSIATNEDLAVGNVLVFDSNEILAVTDGGAGVLTLQNDGGTVLVGGGPGGAPSDLSVSGDLDAGGDITFGASNASLSAALAAAGSSVVPGASYSTALGAGALQSNTTGDLNTASGWQALQSNTTGYYNTATGSRALESNTTGDSNTATGSRALESNTTGDENTATGYFALLSNTTGRYNTATGAWALPHNTTGRDNTATGWLALSQNTTGDSNTAIGSAALYYNYTGTHNTAIGSWALYSSDDSNQNTAIGYGALTGPTFNSPGDRNIAVGYNAGRGTTGSNNILIGNEGVGGESSTIRIGTPGTHTSAFLAGNADIEGDITFGASNTSLSAVLASLEGVVVSPGTAAASTALGAGALQSNTTGDYNTASGWQALQSNTTGNYNTASGSSALVSNTTGFGNTASGSRALESNTTGSGNTASGFAALFYGTTGSGNTAIGKSALYYGGDSNQNTAIGHGALFGPTLNSPGDRNIAVGYNAGRGTTGSNNILIGNEGVGGESSTIRIGTPGTHTSAFLAGDVDIEGDLAVGGAMTGPGAVPIGTVIDWWRPNANFPIPVGFQICNDTPITQGPMQGHNTPDLVDRFVKGVASEAEIGSEGGDSSHKHQSLHWNQTEKSYAAWEADGNVFHFSDWGEGLMIDEAPGSGLYPLNMGSVGVSKTLHTTPSQHEPPHMGLLKLIRIY